MGTRLHDPDVHDQLGSCAQDGAKWYTPVVPRADTKKPSFADIARAQRACNMFLMWRETALHVSPCDRFMSIIDELPFGDWGLARFQPEAGRHKAQGTLVEAASGRILHRFTHDKNIGPISWSKTGHVCLIRQHGIVLMLSSNADVPVIQLELSGTAHVNHPIWKDIMSARQCILCPSGCSVGYCDDGRGPRKLRHWQLPTISSTMLNQPPQLQP